MKKLLQLSLLFISSFLSTCPLVFAEQANSTDKIKLSQELNTIVNAKAVKRVSPIYPRKAAIQKIEGWVQLSYTIEKDGSVSNISVLEHVGHKGFVSRAKQALEQWVFDPAKENGQVIQQFNATVQFDFSLGEHSTNIVSSQIYQLYEKANEAIKQNDIAETKRLIAEMTDIRKTNRDEHNLFNILRADLAGLEGDSYSQLYFLNKTSIKESNTFSGEYIKVFNELKMQTAIQLNQIFDAQQSLTKLKELSQDDNELTGYNMVEQLLDDYIKSNKSIVTEEIFKKGDLIVLSLVRNTFSIDNVEGNINKLDFRCANQYSSYSYQKNNQWIIPQAWQECRVFVYGDKNTSFTLTEYPFSADKS